ncbi:hypothetical protein GQ457_10G009200 [Hibiscus cannabinus]
MFDLAINTTLESKTLAAYPPCFCADFPCPGNWGCEIFCLFQEGVSDLCSLIYSGGLKEIKVVIFLQDFSPLCVIFGFRKRRSSFRNLTI